MSSASRRAASAREERQRTNASSFGYCSWYIARNDAKSSFSSHGFAAFIMGASALFNNRFPSRKCYDGNRSVSSGIRGE